MSKNLPNMLQDTISKIREMVDVNNVIGEPIVVGDVTIIPVSKVSVGFGGGGSGPGGRLPAGRTGGRIHRSELLLPGPGHPMDRRQVPPVVQLNPCRFPCESGSFCLQCAACRAIMSAKATVHNQSKEVYPDEKAVCGVRCSRILFHSKRGAGAQWFRPE